MINNDPFLTGLSLFSFSLFLLTFYLRVELETSIPDIIPELGELFVNYIFFTSQEPTMNIRNLRDKEACGDHSLGYR